MSFPYRWIAHFVHTQTLQVILLRIINVALFGYALFLFRKVFLRAGVTAALTNFTLFIFILIPIVPMLAGEINYDNLTIVLVAIVCLLMQDIIAKLNNKKLPVVDIFLLAGTTLLGSIVKYAFLPVLAACSLIVLIYIWIAFDGKSKVVLRATKKSFGMLKKSTVVLLSVFVLISFGLFSQRFLVNLATYKTPIPTCDKVLTVDDCMSYGPFNRSYILKQSKSPDFKANVFAYAPLWLYGMWFRTFFSVNGNVPNPYWARYETIPPLRLPSTAAVLVIISSFAVVLVYFKRLYKDKFLIFLALMAALYIAALFLENFAAYGRSGQPVAINGRYLLPIVLPLMIIVCRAWQIALTGHSYKLKVALAAIVAVLFIQGGGVFTFMINSNYAWYWPDHRIQTAGFDAHEIASKLVILHEPFYILSP